MVVEVNVVHRRRWGRGRVALVITMLLVVVGLIVVKAIETIVIVVAVANRVNSVDCFLQAFQKLIEIFLVQEEFVLFVLLTPII